MKTKLIARLHSKLSTRAMNIYNPYFKDKNIYANVCLISDNDIERLIKIVRDYGLVGALTPGFETDPKAVECLDELDITSKVSGRLGYIKAVEGKLIGGYQGGEGLYRAISEDFDLNGKNIVIFGAGTVVKTLLHALKSRGIKLKSLVISNRDVVKAENILKEFEIVGKAVSVDELVKQKGDMLINASDIGGSVDDYLFTKEIVSNYNHIMDVTFEVKDTNLIKLASALNIKYITGWSMFTHQAAVVIEEILGEKVDIPLLEELVEKGLSEIV